MLKYTKKYILLLLTSFMLFANQNAFSDIYKRCDNCSNSKLAAEYALNAGGGENSDTVHVYDIVKENINSYIVYKAFMEGEPGFPEYITSARVLTTPFDIKNQFNDLVEAKNRLQDAASETDVPPEIADTAWDLYADTRAQDEFIDWAYNNATISQQISVLATSLMSFVGISFDLTFQLSSGATIVLTFIGNSVDSDTITLGNFKIDFEKSRDANGNRLVINNTATGGVNNFSNGSRSLVDFLAAATRAGIPITYGGSGGGSVRCTLRGTVLTCTFIKRK